MGVHPEGDRLEATGGQHDGPLRPGQAAEGQAGRPQDRPDQPLAEASGQQGHEVVDGAVHDDRVAGALQFLHALVHGPEARDGPFGAGRKAGVDHCEASSQFGEGFHGGGFVPEVQGNVHLRKVYK
ncbi:hypothetical protein AVEN_164425-1 [Araneus ventricosus]|uniref:Uncharacterized protein n=1 Tax=Araneus ventricosus TaxID=182803 RepID=A0A4Y2SX18_ARAVE|nr:hypothetical protein AVEN_87626-1 [Araneus ventricosus]GBN91709.1 hypothetical protein AVEN_164425-1 [Araneus ventricosus]